MLRRFLYLDSELIGEFLAQVERGTFTEEEQRDVVRRDKKLGGDVKVGAGPLGLGAAAGRGVSNEAEATRTVRQTPESGFARLYDLLTEAGDVRWLEGLDDDRWEELRRGEVIEVESVVSASTLTKFAALAEQAEPLMEVMEMFGEAVDAQTREAMTGMKTLGTLFGKKVPIVSRAAGAPKFKFIANLQAEKVRVDLDELEGEATLFGKIQRKLAPSEKHTVIESMPGMSSLPRALRRSMQADVKNDKDLPDLVIRPPAAVVTPIAIYR